LTVKLKLPFVVGVPEIVLPLSVRPPGSAPWIVQVIGGVPPFAAKVCEYAVPTTPLARDVVEIVSVGAVTVMPTLFPVYPGDDAVIVAGPAATPVT
jgi:hypothetical protein